MPAEPTCYGLKKVFVNEKEELNKVNGAGWGIVGFQAGSAAPSGDTLQDEHGQKC